MSRIPIYQPFFNTGGRADRCLGLLFHVVEPSKYSDQVKGIFTEKNGRSIELINDTGKKFAGGRTLFNG